MQWNVNKYTVKNTCARVCVCVSVYVWMHRDAEASGSQFNISSTFARLNREMKSFSPRNSRQTIQIRLYHSCIGFNIFLGYGSWQTKQ